MTAILHKADHAAPAFNAWFYATAATVIPILFLALAVQGNIYADLLAASRRTFQRMLPGDAARVV